MPLNAFNQNSADDDPFQQALLELDSVIDEFRANAAGTAQMAAMSGEAPQNAMASMEAGRAPQQFPQTPPASQYSGYNPDQVTAPVMAMQPMEPERAAAYTGVNSATAGTLPYIVAGIKRATGYDEGKDFETLRREEQMRAQGAREALGETNAFAVEMMAPMGGAGMIMRGAKTPADMAKRMGAYGGTYGAVRGYADPIEPDSLDVGERLTPALMGAGIGAATGYAGGRGIGEISSRMRAGNAPAGGPGGGGGGAPPMTLDDRMVALERGRSATELSAPSRSPMDDEINSLIQNFEKTHGPLPPGMVVDDVPQMRTHSERMSTIARLYAQGKSINEIARDLGESGENVAQAIVRGRDIFGKGALKINLPDDRPGLARLVGAPTPRESVPKKLMQRMQSDAEALLNDVNLYRRSEAIKARKSGKAAPSIDRGELKAAPAEAKAIEAPPEAPKPAAKATAKPGAKTKAPAKRKITGKKKATSPRAKKPAGPEPEDQFALRVSNMSKAQRTKAEKFARSWYDDVSRPQPETLTELDLVRGDILAQEAAERAAKAKK